jgi:hypothetical protein
MRCKNSKAAGLLGICLLHMAPLCAQNLVQNPGFTSDLGGWAPFDFFGLTEQWTAIDAGGDVQSGSIQGTLPASGTFRNPIYASQCVAVQSGKTYLFGTKVLLPSQTTPATAYATVFVNTYPATGCAGNPSMNIVAPNVTTVDAWTATASSVTTGPSDQSIQVDLRVFAPFDTTLISYFDDVYLIDQALTPVTLQSFDVE